MVRYIDDFVLCFQYRADALRAQEALAKKLRKFSLTLEPTKTKLVEFGRYAKSVVRQIRTLRSVGAGGGQLPPATRWAISDGRPYRDNRLASGFSWGVRLMVTETQLKSSMENRPRIDRYD